LLLLLYFLLIINRMNSDKSIIKSILGKVDHLYQNVSEVFINYYDSFSDNNNNNNNKNTSNYITNSNKNEQINIVFNDETSSQDSKRNSKQYINLESGSIFNVKYPKNFVKVYNDTMYRPVINRNNLINNGNGLPYDSDDSSKRKSFQSFVDLGKRISSIDLYSPIRNVNIGDKFRSPIQTHINPFLNDIYSRLSYISSNSLPYVSDSSKYLSPRSNSYLELSDNDDQEEDHQQEDKDKTENKLDGDDDNNLNRQNKSYDDLKISKSNIDGESSFYTVSGHETYHPLNSLSKIKISKTNPFYGMENRDFKPLMNYSESFDFDESSKSSSKNKKNKSRKDESVFFDVNKLNKYYKEYNGKKNLTSNNKNNSVSGENKNLYEKKLIREYQKSLSNTNNYVNNPFVNMIPHNSSDSINNNRSDNNDNNNNGIDDDISNIFNDDIYHSNDRNTIKNDTINSHTKDVIKHSNEGIDISDISLSSSNNCSSCGSSCSDVIEDDQNLQSVNTMPSSSLRHSINSILSYDSNSSNTKKQNNNEKN